MVVSSSLVINSLVVQEEKERQLAKVKERVTQVRYERTLTMAADTPTSEGERSRSQESLGLAVFDVPLFQQAFRSF